MNAHSTEYLLWQAACHAEREAWQAVQGSLPGSAQYDPAAWGRWVDALHKANVALQACLQAPLRRPPKRNTLTRLRVLGKRSEEAQ